MRRMEEGPDPDDIAEEENINKSPSRSMRKAAGVRCGNQSVGMPLGAGGNIVDYGPIVNIRKTPNYDSI